MRITIYILIANRIRNALNAARTLLSKDVPRLFEPDLNQVINRGLRNACTSGSVVEYRLAKARVAGSNPVSCF